MPAIYSRPIVEPLSAEYGTWMCRCAVLSITPNFHGLGLGHKVLYVPYPMRPTPSIPCEGTDNNEDGAADAAAARSTEVPEGYTRVFGGHFNYEATESQVRFALAIACGADIAVGDMFFQQKTVEGESKGTGVVFIDVATGDVPRVISGLHRRVLFDEGGFWLAITREQIALLNAYTACLHYKRGASDNTGYNGRPMKTVKMSLATAPTERQHSTTEESYHPLCPCNECQRSTRHICHRFAHDYITREVPLMAAALAAGHAMQELDVHTHHARPIEVRHMSRCYANLCREYGSWLPPVHEMCGAYRSALGAPFGPPSAHIDHILQPTY